MGRGCARTARSQPTQPTFPCPRAPVHQCEPSPCAPTVSSGCRHEANEGTKRRRDRRILRYIEYPRQLHHILCSRRNRWSRRPSRSHQDTPSMQPPRCAQCSQTRAMYTTQCSSIPSNTAKAVQLPTPCRSLVESWLSSVRSKSRFEHCRSVGHWLVTRPGSCRYEAFAPFCGNRTGVRRKLAHE